MVAKAKKQKAQKHRNLIHVGEKMTALIDGLKKGFKGFRFPLSQVSEQSWGSRYAIVNGYYLPHVLVEDDEYTHFDGEQLRKDFEQFVVDHFEADVVLRDGDDAKVSKHSLIVNFRAQAQEIEVYYKGSIIIDNYEFLEQKDRILSVMHKLLDPTIWPGKGNQTFLKGLQKEVEGIFGVKS